MDVNEVDALEKEYQTLTPINGLGYLLLFFQPLDFLLVWHGASLLTL